MRKKKLPPTPAQEEKKPELTQEILQKWADMYSNENLLIHAKATGEIGEFCKKLDIPFKEVRKLVDKVVSRAAELKYQEQRAAENKRKLEEKLAAEKEKQERNEEKEKARIKAEQEKEEYRKKQAEIKEATLKQKQAALMAKEQARLEKLSKAEADEEAKKILLDRLENEWQTCEDELFQVGFEADWKKALHYFAKRLMLENKFLTFEESQELLVYDKQEGIYLFGAENFVQSQVEKRLLDKAVLNQVKEIIAKIRRNTLCSREIIYQQPEYLKPVGNGLLNIKTMKLEPFSSDYIFINKIEVPFISSADCPKFKKFVAVITSDENKNPQEKHQILVKQWLGYCLLNDCRWEKALLLYGKGGNGKSVLLKVFIKFLGNKNVVSIPLQYLEANNFALARFVGKAANIFTDLPTQALKQTSKFKIIVSGDQISVERKGKDSYEAKIPTKQLFSCNEVPRTQDLSDAFFDRWHIIKFLHNFRDSKERIEKLEEHYFEELPGILNWAIEGLKDLLNGGFTKHMDRAEVMDFWLRHSDSVAAFNLDMLEVDQASEETKEDIFATYENYCSLKNYQKEDITEFWSRLKALRTLEEYRPGSTESDKKRRIRGLRLKPLPKEAENA